MMKKKITCRDIMHIDVLFSWPKLRVHQPSSEAFHFETEAMSLAFHISSEERLVKLLMISQ